jgi:cytochrome c2
MAVTFDGDVWSITGMKDDLQEVRWRRFASGLHEPLNIVARDGQMFVLDRNGLWRLRDTDDNGEADEHEMFSNAFTQTAETREFVTGLKLAPDGSFILAKGGQQSTTVGRHNGTVLRVSPDGRTVTMLGRGLRMPFIGVHPRTGLITASDQQGHYIPTTPLHVIEGDRYYGFLPLFLPKEKYPAPIAEPLTWIPHPINASGAAQTWLVNANMGPLNDALIHLGYYRPEIFRVLWNARGSRPQAAVVSLTRDLAFPPLSGAVNPADGRLYTTGFQIWGTEARQISGLARIRYTGIPSTLPREVAAMDQGILLRFDTPLDARRAADAANFSAERWNYRRTPDYGSPHFKLDGSKGQEALTPSSAYVSKDRRAVFVGIPDMRVVMQMRLGWALATEAGSSFAHNAYFTPHELTRFDAATEGFDPVTVDLSPRVATAAAKTPITVEEGRRVSELMGCVACHSVDGSTLGKVGPSWKGLFGSTRVLADRTRVVADEGYLRESIKEPAAKVVGGFDKTDTGMPSYEGVITDAQIEALVLYLKSLRSP